MDEPPVPIVIFRKEAEAVEGLRAAVANVDLAHASLREAVVAARIIKVPWSKIGEAMRVTRQAAAERFGDEVKNQLAWAWQSIEERLAEIAVIRGADPLRPLECLDALTAEGLVPQDLRERAGELWTARAKAVHDSKFRMTSEEAERLTDVALPMAGVLYLIAHPS